MSNLLYPAKVRGLTYTVLKACDFDTIVQKSASNVETRLAQSQNPVWHWTYIYDYLKDYDFDLVPGLSYTDFQTLIGFYMGRQGQFDDFLLDDPDDNMVGPALLPSGSPNPQAQLQLVQDPITGLWYTPVQRNFGGQFYEDITDLGPSGMQAFANGVLKSGGGIDYSIGFGLAINGFSSQGLYLAWTGAPTPPITAQFSFYFRVRFETDTQDFEKFVDQLWTIGGSSAGSGSGQLKMCTARTGSAP